MKYKYGETNVDKIPSMKHSGRKEQRSDSRKYIFKSSYEEIRIKNLYSHVTRMHYRKAGI